MLFNYLTNISFSLESINLYMISCPDSEYSVHDIVCTIRHNLIFDECAMYAIMYQLTTVTQIDL